MLLIVGVYNGIHIMVKYYEQLNKGLNNRQALEEVILTIGAALFLTSFTTATGCFSLIASNIRIMQEFGVVLAAGAMLMFVLTTIIIPALLLQIKPPPAAIIARQAAGSRLKAAQALGRWNERHPRIVLGASLLLLLISLVGIMRINTNAPVLEDLRPGTKLADDLTFIE